MLGSTPLREPQPLGYLVRTPYAHRLLKLEWVLPPSLQPTPHLVFSFFFFFLFPETPQGYKTTGTNYKAFYTKFLLLITWQGEVVRVELLSLQNFQIFWNCYNLQSHKHQLRFPGPRATSGS